MRSGSLSSVVRAEEEAFVLDAHENPICPICGVVLARRMYEVRGYDLWHCRGCGVRTIHPRPSGPPEDLYDEAYFQGRKEGIGYGDYVGRDNWYGPKVFSEIRGRLATMFPGRGSLLDVGCAAGHLVEAAAAGGWHAVGVDVGRFAVEHGRARGLELYATTLRAAAFPAGTFDVITTLHTVEHLPDPSGDLREMRRIAREGALLVVEVPNVHSLGSIVRRDRWGQLKPPEHINFFHRRSLAMLLSRCGWRPIHAETNNLEEMSIAAVARGRRSVERIARVAASLGAIRLTEKLFLGGNLRIFAVTAPAGEER
jgi:SAM-dependent methyltransferase